MFNNYSYDNHNWEEDYEIESEFELEMNENGYKFITNFRVERENVYRKAAELHNLDYRIENEVYSSKGHKLGDDGSWMKAFYVSSKIYDLSDFWDTVEQLRETESV